MIGNLPRMPKENLKFLFEFVKKAVLSEGGDGYGYILSDNPEYLADVFGETEDWFTERHEYTHERVYVFSNNQEAIFFGPLDMNTKFQDIVVRIEF